MRSDFWPSGMQVFFEAGGFLASSSGLMFGAAWQGGGMSMGAASMVTAGTVALSIGGGLALVGVGYFVLKSNWSYETSLVKLKEKMSEKLNGVLKYMIHDTFIRVYDKMVEECERHN